MKLAAYKRGETLSELVRRTYVLKGVKARELAKEAEAAILRSNPHLKDLKKVADGSVVIVPNLPGVAYGETLPVDSERELSLLLRGALSNAKHMLEDSIKLETREADETVKLIKSSEAKELLKQRPELKEQFAKIEDQTKARLKDVETLKAAHKKGLMQLERDLQAFIGEQGTKN